MILAISHAYRTQTYEMLDFVLERVDVNRRCTRNTPLHHAVLWEDPEIVRRMMKRGAHPSRPNFNGFSPLCDALLADLPEIAEIMIRYTQHPIVTKYDDDYLNKIQKDTTLTQLVFKLLPDIDCYVPTFDDGHHDHILAIGASDDEGFIKAMEQMSVDEIIRDYPFIKDMLAQKDMPESQKYSSKDYMGLLLKLFIP